MQNMQAYITLRVLTGVLTLFAVTVIVFGLVNFTPGDVVDSITQDQAVSQEEVQEIRHELGLDRPLIVRYFDWLGHIVRLDFGESLSSGRSVNDIIKDAAPVSIQLGLIAWVISILIGIPFGVYVAVRRGRLDDQLLRITSIIGLSAPTFWIATMVVVLPAMWWGWVPPLFFKRFSDDPLGSIAIMITPALILASHSSCTLMRFTRSAVLEVLREDYVRTARAKGLGEFAVLARHVVKNAMLPVLTISGTQLVALISGVVVLETIFNLPGLGRTMITALNTRDYPVVQGINLMLATVVVVTNLLVDLLYKVFDPRVTY